MTITLFCIIQELLLFVIHNFFVQSIILTLLEISTCSPFQQAFIWGASIGVIDSLVFTCIGIKNLILLLVFYPGYQIRSKKVALEVTYVVVM